jgi:4-hydroxy-3-polyprenylbenzoate decarboxylase
MMFNKILIIANDDVDLSDPMFYLNALSELDPESDFLYSSGPLDVLDHASDNMGYGGKLGIDLTPRFPEEKALNFSQPPGSNELSFSNPHAEIIDSSFYKNSKGEKVLLILYIRKMEGYNRENLIRKLIFAEEYKVASTYIIVDEGLMGGSVKDVLWYLLSNLETGRDLVIKHLPAEKKIFFDGTSKRVKEDNFPREWPNVVTMSKDVIKKIDKNWEAYGLGEFISSPSNIYYNLKVTPGARVRK